jgi:hypothetical protein
LPHGRVVAALDAGGGGAEADAVGVTVADREHRGGRVARVRRHDRERPVLASHVDLETHDPARAPPREHRLHRPADRAIGVLEARVRHDRPADRVEHERLVDRRSALGHDPQRRAARRRIPRKPDRTPRPVLRSDHDLPPEHVARRIHDQELRPRERRLHRPRPPDGREKEHEREDGAHHDAMLDAVLARAEALT